MPPGHYPALLVAYAVALASALGMASLRPQLWPPRTFATFLHPWREVAWALGAACAVICLGLLYSSGWLLPATGRQRPLLDAVNQLIIYSPFPLLLVIRRHPPETAWLRTGEIPLRISIGLGLAILALFSYSMVRTLPAGWPGLVSDVYQPRNVTYLVQVLLEDMSIGLVFVRFRSALGLRWTLILVAVLFSAAHIPGLLANGADVTALLHLIGDAGLGVGVLAVLQRMEDVWWFWMVHFALDMTQFSTPGIIS